MGNSPLKNFPTRPPKSPKLGKFPISGHSDNRIDAAVQQTSVRAYFCKYCNEPQASALASQNTGRTGKTGDSWGLVLISLSTSLFSPPAQVFSQSPLISAKKKLCYPNNTMAANRYSAFVAVVSWIFGL